VKKLLLVFILIGFVAVISLAFRPAEIYLPSLSYRVYYNHDTIIWNSIEESMVATVLRVVDGDTIEVITDGGTETLRLIGVDTPETVHPNKDVEFYGPEASAFTKTVLYEGRTIWLTFGEEKRGYYGRLLCYVWIYYKKAAFVHFNSMLILNGFSKAYLKYDFDLFFMEEFKKAQHWSEDMELGMWQREPGE
jgi:micrococcal nuclease